jgi:hypothetical protein
MALNRSLADGFRDSKALEIGTEARATSRNRPPPPLRDVLIEAAARGARADKVTEAFRLARMIDCET